MSDELVRWLGRRSLSRRLIYTGQRRRCADLIAKIGSAMSSQDSVLDVGAGTGNTTELLREMGYHVTPLDVTDISYIDEVTPVIYDGRQMPFEDDHFEVALIITVLHHAHHPDQVLREARRVARRVIVIEDVTRGRLHGVITKVWDSVLNLEFIGHPHSNDSDQGWRERFRALGFKVITSRSWWAALFMWQVLYVLERDDP